MVDTLLVSADGTSCEASMVKMSVDFPYDAALCQRFLSAKAQFVSRPKVNADRPFALGTNYLQFHWLTQVPHPQYPNGRSRPPILRNVTCAEPREVIVPLYRRLSNSCPMA